MSEPGGGHPLAPPRCRVELRQPGLAAKIVGFADTTDACWLLLAVEAGQMRAAGETGALAVVDQETDADIAARRVP